MQVAIEDQMEELGEPLGFGSWQKARWLSRSGGFEITAGTIEITFFLAELLRVCRIGGRV